jgi:hypothetical protein
MMIGDRQQQQVETHLCERVDLESGIVQVNCHGWNASSDVVNTLGHQCNGISVKSLHSESVGSSSGC